MWTLVREHLVAKIAVVLVATLTLGFGVPALLGTRLQAREMARSSEDSAALIAYSLAAGVRTAMLTGNGITARKMIEDARARVGTSEIRIYAPSGEEVFAPKPPPPPADELPAHVQAVMSTARVQPGPDGGQALPIPNEPRCRKCHADGELRAVLTISTEGADLQLSGGQETADALSKIVESAFVQIMTGEKEDELDAYFAELTEQVPGLVAVAILDAEREIAYGDAEIAVPPELAGAVLSSGKARFDATSERALSVHALPMEPQCLACHEKEPAIRGAIAVAIDPSHREWTGTLVHATDVSLRHVMLAGLGRLIARFVDTVPATHTVSALTLHDAEGRLYRDAFAQPDPPPMVAAALASAESSSEVAQTEAGGEVFRFVEPLDNDAECQQCHGADYDVRGAIEVTLDTTRAADSRADMLRNGLVFGLATIVLSLGVLYFGLRWLVVRPVARMGDVAELVGAGNLDSTVEVRTADEIGRLGQRLNEMIADLRRKLELAKFVSAATVQSIDASTSAVTRKTARTRMAVLFSDVRGFTAFSETVDPEEVVEMLNRYLDAQAEVVHRYGGDIDKFVGDELMANFSGPDMEVRALRCAVDMLDAVARANDALPADVPRLQVGIGVNVGDLVFGAMGAQARMDFTVIGDAVNLGARLCDAAKPGEVLISEAVREAVGDVPDLKFEPQDPLTLKGKRAPVPVYTVTRST